VLAPVEAQPTDILHDGLDVFPLFLDRVRVVEAQIAVAAEGERDAEVQADRLGMADVQVAVGLRREPRDHGLVTARLQVRAHDVADEVRADGFSPAHGISGRSSRAASSCQKSRPTPSRALIRRRAE
jgi:hypothetical protein